MKPALTRSKRWEAVQLQLRRPFATSACHSCITLYESCRPSPSLLRNQFNSLTHLARRIQSPRGATAGGALAIKKAKEKAASRLRIATQATCRVSPSTNNLGIPSPVQPSFLRPMSARETSTSLSHPQQTSAYLPQEHGTVRQLDHLSLQPTVANTTNTPPWLRELPCTACPPPSPTVQANHGR